MEIHLETEEQGCLRLRVAGDIRLDPLMEEPVCDQLGSDVYRRTALVDLCDAVRIDSSGISWLLVCHKRFRSAGGRLILHSAPPLIENTLRVLRLHQVFEMADREAAAREMASGG